MRPSGAAARRRTAQATYRLYPAQAGPRRTPLPSMRRARSHRGCAQQGGRAQAIMAATTVSFACNQPFASGARREPVPKPVEQSARHGGDQQAEEHVADNRQQAGRPELWGLMTGGARMRQPPDKVTRTRPMPQAPWSPTRATISSAMAGQRRTTSSQNACRVRGPTAQTTRMMCGGNSRIRRSAA